jgi:hypothetical protein
MANEITISCSLSITKNGATVASSYAGNATLAGEDMLTNTQNVGTSAEAVVVGDLASAGYAFFKNMDATNFIQLALDSGVSTQIFAKLLPGEISLVKLATTTIYAKADTGACRLLVTACEL